MHQKKFFMMLQTEFENDYKQLTKCNQMGCVSALQLVTALPVWISQSRNPGLRNL